MTEVSDVAATADAHAHGSFRVVTAADADGGLRLTLLGDTLGSEIDLRDIVLAALRSRPPRVEIDLRDVRSIGEASLQLLTMCARLAQRLDVEYKVTHATGLAADTFPGGDAA